MSSEPSSDKRVRNRPSKRSARGTGGTGANKADWPQAGPLEILPPNSADSPLTKRTRLAKSVQVDKNVAKENVPPSMVRIDDRPQISTPSTPPSLLRRAARFQVPLVNKGSGQLQELSDQMNTGVTKANQPSSSRVLAGPTHTAVQRLGTRTPSIDAEMPVSSSNVMPMLRSCRASRSNNPSSSGSSSHVAGNSMESMLDGHGDNTDDELDGERNTLKDVDYHPQDNESSSEDDYIEGDGDQEENIDDGDREGGAPSMQNNQFQNSTNGTRQKRRVRQTYSKERLERKTARNSGQSYITENGKVIPPKSTKPLEMCSKKCSTKVSSDTCDLLCSSLWTGLADHDKRVAFVSNLIEVQPKGSENLNITVSPSRRKQRKYTHKYHIPVDGANVEVCKKCFLKVFCLTPKFIEKCVQKKLSNVLGIIQDDQRGHASSSRVTEGQRREMRDHLQSFPRYKSHYSRNRTDKEFLDSNLTMKIMYDEYVEKCTTQTVSRWLYEKEFHEMGLKIKPYKTDTCNKCDQLASSIMYATNMVEREEKLKEQSEHHSKWEKALKMKNHDKEIVKHDSKKEMVVFDMQQCLPTPHLNTSVVFYKRQLWVYNLTLHICSNGKSVHNMWHEGEGERGPNQVGSALYHYLMALPDTVEEVTLWSDTCGGQNKNSIVTAALQTALMHKSTIKKINQKFLVAGHTHLECDSDHSVIEGKKKNVKNILVPRDWFNLVELASKRFSVNRLTQDKQLDFKLLLKGRDSPLVKRKKTEDKDLFLWKNVVWLQHNQALPPGIVAFKYNYEDVDFKLLNLKRKKRSPLTLQPSLAYNGPCAISAAKKRDLLSLLYLVDPECHVFYRNLVADGDIEDLEADIYSSGLEEEDDE